MTKQLIARISVLVLGWFAMGFAFAQGASLDRTIRLIVPFAPGGTTDILARQYGQRLATVLGQPVVIENKPGGGTMIGAEFVAKSSPDGLTLLVGTPSLWLNPHLYKRVPYRLEDFTPVSTFAAAPFVLSVSKALPVSSLPELLRYGRAEPKRLSYGILGTGGPTHLLSKLFEDIGKFTAVEVPYRGTGQVWPDLSSGRIHFYFDAIGTSLPMYRSNKIQILGITSEQRSPAAPDIPTFAELGFPQLNVDTVFGLFAPARTPPAVIGRLSKAVEQVAASEELRSALLVQGTIPMASTPDAYTAIIRKDLEFWLRVIKPLNLQLEP
jgi:tripartite-type tricarboxylate transporter receptor subunit TctC